nr:MAG TPA: hypothetical protein [Caudoviricetes sp.]
MCWRRCGTVWSCGTQTPSVVADIGSAESPLVTLHYLLEIE